MYDLLLATSGEPLPIGLTSAVVLLVSLLFAAVWLLYLYR